MIKNILKQIWNQRRSNGWLFTEFLIVFVLMWFCVDVLYNYTYAEQQSKGYDISNTYHIEIKSNPTQTIFTSDADSLDRVWNNPLAEVMRRISSYSEIESASMWSGTDAYTTDEMYQGYTTDSIKVQGANIRYVTKEYFDVFRTVLLTEESDFWDPFANPLPAVVSEDLADSIFHRTNVIGEKFYDYYESGLQYRVVGVMARQKNTDYTCYQPYIITPLRKEFYSQQWLPYISVRVRPEYNVGFAERFVQNMALQLQIAPFYLFNVQSYEEQKMIRDVSEGITTYIKSARMMILFFFVNVFLGLIGTFWFRTRHRRSEIGLRMAMGSSRMKICSQLIGEGLLLLTLATIPAIVICVNMVLGDVTITHSVDASMVRFVVCVCITWCLMAMMVAGGIWFPARQAMAIQPAAALHEE